MSRYKDQKKVTLAEWIKELNFYYSGVRIEYDNTDGTPDGDGYCRNSQIINTKVTDVNISEVADTIANTLDQFKYKVEPIDEYCIDRILRIHKAYEENNWSIHVKNGYYGEEIGGVYFTKIDSVAENLEKCVAMKTIKEKMEFILTLEYGYVLNDLKNREYSIKEIARSSVKLLQNHYYKKISICEYYKNYKLPICLVLNESPSFYKDEDKEYRLIDGYHRFASSVGKDKILIIVAR